MNNYLLKQITFYYQKLIPTLKSSYKKIERKNIHIANLFQQRNTIPNIMAPQNTILFMP